MGNLYQQTAAAQKPEKRETFNKRASDFYSRVCEVSKKKYTSTVLLLAHPLLTLPPPKHQALRIDSHNMYAANGIGCVLADRGLISEAKEVFGKVRESSSEVSQHWLNLAHIYVEQERYVSAIKLYETVLTKLYGNRFEMEKPRFFFSPTCSLFSLRPATRKCLFTSREHISRAASTPKP